ncbi:MAG TPA: AgmX/PglI C-terminal domain-containing protein, partial [Polyangia bacterium]|nr:AgmX/PglI C-terminal domain-containing protein [Polyangia bacterium]
VVIDETSKTSRGPSETVQVPVEVPEGVRGVIAGLGGSEYGANFSGGGLGLSGVGYGGGGGTGQGTIGLGSIGTIGKGAGGSSAMSGFGAQHVLTAHAARAPEVLIGEARVLGSLDKSIIRRVVRRRLNAIRFCYEKEAQKHASLAGRIELRLFIDSSTGRVTASGIQSTTMDNAEVENCVAEEAAKWEFPIAVGGGMVQVSYPLVFKLADETPSEKTIVSPDPYPEE